MFIFLIFLAIGLGLTLFFILKKDKKQIIATNPIQKTPIVTPSVTPTNTPVVVEPKKCVCYALSNVGQSPSTFHYLECKNSGVVSKTLSPNEIIFVCAYLNTVICDDLNGTFSQAWTEDCPQDCV